MERSRDHIVFWCLLAVQAVGSYVLIWTWGPGYDRLISTGAMTTSPRQFGISLIVVGVMQAAYWPAHALKQHLRFRGNDLVGHTLITIGEFSIFFAAAVTTVVLFDHFRESPRIPWRLAVLALTLFAVSCFKYQLMSVGEKLIDLAKSRVAAEP
jgi:hypothetical protein